MNASNGTRSIILIVVGAGAVLLPVVFFFGSSILQAMGLHPEYSGPRYTIPGGKGLTIATNVDENGDPLVERRQITAPTDKQVDELGAGITPQHPERELGAAGVDFLSCSGCRLGARPGGRPGYRDGDAATQPPWIGGGRWLNADRPGHSERRHDESVRPPVEERSSGAAAHFLRGPGVAEGASLRQGISEPPRSVSPGRSVPVL